jgi:glycosyltransferase involved in cell wall biosynthesis
MRHPVYSRIKKKDTVIKLSILIPTLFSRIKNIVPLIEELNYQIQAKPVQVLWVGDNRSMSIGEKRNHLLDIAKGEWISFVDDDDLISGHYVDTLLEAIDANPDKKVICFWGTQNTDGQTDLPFRYNISYHRNHKTTVDGKRWKVMLPDHLCCWRRDKIETRFQNKSLGEDHDWARNQAMTYVEEDQVLLEETLYHYEFSRERTETRRG